MENSNKNKFYINIKNLRFQKLNILFSDSTLLYPALNSDHPNNTKGNFFKRLEDIDNYRVLLFAYFNADFHSDELNKSTTIELQIFDKMNNLSDKIIIYDGMEGVCNWYRDFSINKDHILSLRDQFYCIDDSDTSENNKIYTYKNKIFNKQYIIKNGKILEYFSQQEGQVKECIKIKSLEQSWYSEGNVKEHLKTGKWIEYDYIYDDKENDWVINYITRYYEKGVKNNEYKIMNDDELDKIDCLRD
ncbi:MAG: hypothetical protein FWF54_01015 [Candidatus Azobacteroides sp.]|nr:hypothetical protein [Candidatus Azobacteroides sp.]